MTSSPAALNDSPVVHALDQLAVAVEHLVKVVGDGGLDHLDDLELVTVMQSFEQVRNRLPLVDHRMIGDGERRDLPGRLCHRSMSTLLVSVLRLSPGEASRRVRAAAAVGEQTSMLGAPVPPRWPVLAAAQAAGTVSPEQVAVIERALAPLDRRGFDPADLAAGEALLVEHAAVFGPKPLTLLAAQVVDRVDPDGTLPEEQLELDRRFVELRPARGGGWVGQFRLTGPVGAQLHALLDPLARPRVTTTVTAAGRLVEGPDPRHHGQRMHDALADLCSRHLRDGTVGVAAGTPATVIITVDADDLARRTGYGSASDGTPMPAAEIARVGDEAEVWLAGLTPAGAVLTLGRTRRIASRAQTVALAARDRGCSFPGCDTAPEWCERHHIRAWIDGGPTDLNNLTLVCRYHHHHFEQAGWRCRINDDQLPEWIPPRHLDPDQRPLTNHRITLNTTTHHQRRERQRRREADGPGDWSNSLVHAPPGRVLISTTGRVPGTHERDIAAASVTP